MGSKVVIKNGDTVPVSLYLDVRRQLNAKTRDLADAIKVQDELNAIISDLQDDIRQAPTVTFEKEETIDE